MTDYILLYFNYSISIYDKVLYICVIYIVVEFNIVNNLITTIVSNMVIIQ